MPLVNGSWLGKLSNKDSSLKISNIEGIEIDNKDIASIVTKNFPDMRQMVNILQYIKETGEIHYDTSAFQTEVKEDLYKQIISNNDFLSNYNFIVSTFGQENIGDLLYLMGRPFIEYAISKDSKVLDKMQDIVDVVTEYNSLLNNTLDPIVLGVSLVGKVQKIIQG